MGNKPTHTYNISSNIQLLNGEVVTLNQIITGDTYGNAVIENKVNNTEVKSENRFCIISSHVSLDVVSIQTTEELCNAIRYCLPWMDVARNNFIVSYFKFHKKQQLTEDESKQLQDILNTKDYTFVIQSIATPTIEHSVTTIE